MLSSTCWTGEMRSFIRWVPYTFTLRKLGKIHSPKQAGKSSVAAGEWPRYLLPVTMQYHLTILGILLIALALLHSIFSLL